MKPTQSFRIAIGLSQLLFTALLPIWLKLLSYLHPVVLPVVWICVTLFVFFAVYYLRKESIHIHAFIIKMALSLYSLGLFILLFFRPANQEYTEINLIPFRTIIHFLSEQGNFLIAFYNITANILLFIPYGIAALMLYKNLSKARRFLTPLVVILLIETAQHLTKRGSMDIDDLILNLLGVWLGYLLYPYINKVIKTC
ncbi:VanZ family protein [Bacillus sp. FJAT-29814]|uniref:VanZ family protein n=1 Tax=Bacillus sp. FJAT-29814 TaxID=1729688 RepID=UPI000833C98D|nr:VanZ family protein [Bacillus sp. FJAT-29814]